MRMKSFFVLIAGFFCAIASGQDSAKVAKTLNDLAYICRNLDFNDPKVQQLGLFYKAAPYVLYQGSDPRRKWKDVADYRVAAEKQQVENVCFMINASLNQDTTYKIIKYSTKTATGGKWHILSVSYKRNGKPVQNSYSFLKVGNRFAIGKIN